MRGFAASFSQSLYGLRPRRMLRRSACTWLSGALHLAVEPPIADQAAVRPPPKEEIGQIDGAEMRPAKLLLFIARRADKMRVRHGDNVPESV